jgi:hypothetical protein
MAITAAPTPIPILAPLLRPDEGVDGGEDEVDVGPGAVVVGCDVEAEDPAVAASLALLAAAMLCDNMSVSVVSHATGTPSCQM